MDIRSQVELRLIAQDCTDLIRIIRSLSGSSTYASVGFGTPPFFMLVAEESYQYFASLRGGLPENDLHGALFESYAQSVKKTRARIKLFDDTEGGLNRLIETLALIHGRSHKWFIGLHQGIIGRLAQRFQPDLGIFWFEQRPIASTHAALLTLGLTHDQIDAVDIGRMHEEIRQFASILSIATGDYISRLARVLKKYDFVIDLNLSPLDIPSVPITHTDHYGERAYVAIANSFRLSRPELTAAMLFLMTQVNYVEDVLARLLDPQSTLLLRARFLTAYHAASALKQVIALENPSAGEPLAQVADAILGTPEYEFFTTAPARSFRNICAHYGLRDAGRFITNDGDPMDDMAKGVCSNGVVAIMGISQRHLSCISNAFVRVVSKNSLSSSRARLGDNT